MSLQIQLMVRIKERKNNHLVNGWLKTVVDVEYVQYDNNYQNFKDCIVDAGCLISMRMHPGIFASAYGVPTILLDQRHKFFDSFSPVESEVVQIMDPEKLDAETLVQHVRSNLSESHQDRMHRFQANEQCPL